jgi:hypothetical protein
MRRRRSPEGVGLLVQQHGQTGGDVVRHVLRRLDGLLVGREPHDSSWGEVGLNTTDLTSRVVRGTSADD